MGRIEIEEVILRVTAGSGVHQNVRAQATFDDHLQGQVVIADDLIPYPPTVVISRP